MKKIIISLFLIVNMVLADSGVQVFISSNSNDFNKENLTKLYSGTLAGYQASSKDLFKDIIIEQNNNILAKGAAAGTISVGAAAAANGGLHGLDLNGGLIGLAVIGTIIAGMFLFDLLKEKPSNDNYYIYVGKSVDSKGIESLVYGFIVSEYIQSPYDVEKLALNKIK